MNNHWLKAELNRLMGTTRPSSKQRKLACKGRSLRVETLEPRRLLAAWVPPNLAQGEIFHGDFEHPEGFQLEARTQGSRPGNLESPYVTQVHLPGSGAKSEVKNGSVVPDGAGARAGNSVFESHIEKQTVPSAWYREEVIARPNGLTTPNVDYWYGFSMYFAQDFQPDYSFEIYSQWFVPGTITGGPLMSLATKSDSGGTINHNSLRLTHDKLGLIATADLSDLKGKWTDWVVHARWSTSASGTVEIYRDGQLIGAKNGVTLRSGDIQGGFNGVPKQRLGLYKGSWKAHNQIPNAPAPTEMTMYYDEWRIARSNNGTNLFDVVDPARGGGGVGNPTSGTFEFETLLPVTASSGDSLETKSDAAASGGAWMLYRSDTVGDFVTFTANVSEAGTYDLALQSRLNAFRGQFQLSVDGTDVGGVNDAYAATPSFGEIPLATGVPLTAGSHQFRFTVTGKNSASNDFQISLDQLELTALETSTGDFDTDGDTDGADFLQWQRGFGTTYVAADLNDWEDNYGSSATSAVAALAATAPAPVVEALSSDVDVILALDLQLSADKKLLDEVFEQGFSEGSLASQPAQHFGTLESDPKAELADKQVSEPAQGLDAEDSDSLDHVFDLLGGAVLSRL